MMPEPEPEHLAQPYQQQQPPPLPQQLADDMVWIGTLPSCMCANEHALATALGSVGLHPARYTLRKLNRKGRVTGGEAGGGPGGRVGYAILGLLGEPPVVAASLELVLGMDGRELVLPSGEKWLPCTRRASLPADGGGGGRRHRRQTAGAHEQQQHEHEQEQEQPPHEREPSVEAQLQPVLGPELGRRIRCLLSAEPDLLSVLQRFGLHPGLQRPGCELGLSVAQMRAAVCAVHRQRPRRCLHHDGVPIPSELATEAFDALQALQWPCTPQRSGVTADGYIVLAGDNDSARRYPRLSACCASLMDWADPAFHYSAVAVTKNFRGSPHIDTHDVTFQYACSFGRWARGGELCIEDSADPLRLVHTVNTKGRMVRVDGRYPHWVRSFDRRGRPATASHQICGAASSDGEPSDARADSAASEDRFSLIFYSTDAADSTCRRSAVYSDWRPSGRQP
jgi:hypothetical protein